MSETKEVAGLVARLLTKRMRVHDLSGVGWEDDPDCHLAARELERLSKELEECRAAYRNARDSESRLRYPDTTGQ